MAEFSTWWDDFQTVPELLPTLVGPDYFEAICPACRCFVKVGREDGGEASFDCSNHCTAIDIGSAINTLRNRAGADNNRNGRRLDSEAADLVDGAAFVFDAPTVVPAVWGVGNEVLWAEGEPFGLVGPQGVGKTTLQDRLVLGRLGLPGFEMLLGQPVRRVESKVLLLALDRPAQVARSLRRMVTEADADQLRDRLLVRRRSLQNLLADPEQVVRMAVAVGACTVFIDSAKDTGLVLTTDEGGMAFNAMLQALVREGIEVNYTHHQRKSDGTRKPKELGDVYGSNWITAGNGSVVLLWGKAGDPVVELSHLKQPAVPLGPLSVVHNQDAGTLELDMTARSTVVEMVEVASEGITVSKVAQKLFGSIERNEIEKARRRLDAAVREGKLTKVPGGLGAPVRYFAGGSRNEGHAGVTQGHAPGSRTPHPF